MKNISEYGYKHRFRSKSVFLFYESDAITSTLVHCAPTIAVTSPYGNGDRRWRPAVFFLITLMRSGLDEKQINSYDLNLRKSSIAYRRFSRCIFLWLAYFFKTLASPIRCRAIVVDLEFLRDHRPERAYFRWCP